jgi:hypothetical protein
MDLIGGPPAQLGGPALGEVSGVTLAAGSFVLVLAVGTALANYRGRTVDRAVDRTLDGSPLAVVYGLIGFGLVAVIGAYVLSQAAQVGLGGPVLGIAAAVVVGGALATLAGFGYLIVGTVLTEFEGARRPWLGAVIGAVLSALPWLLVPPLPALAVWTLVAAVGLGSPTRHYVHAERTVETEARG